MEVRPFTVPGVAAQAEERCRLAEQVVRYRPMRIVTDGAILCHRRVFVGEGALFLGVTPVTDHVDRRLLQIVLGLAVRIVAIRTRDLAFLDGMVRRHRILSIDIRVALVARERFVDRHRRPLLPADIRVLNVNCLLYIRVRMWIVAVRTGDSVPGMG